MPQSRVSEPRLAVSRLEWAALLFAMTFPSLMSWLEFWVLPHQDPHTGVNLPLVFAGGKLLQFAFPLLYLVLVAPRELRPARPSAAGLGYALAFALVVAVGVGALYFPWLKHLHPFTTIGGRINHILERFHLASPAGFIAFGLFIAVLHALLEEYYWRWFVFGRLRRHVPLALALVVSSLAFMSHHVLVLGYYFPDHFWSAALPFSLCVAGGGFVWAWLYHRTGNLYACWLSHLLVDAAIMFVGYDLAWRG